MQDLREFLPRRDGPKVPGLPESCAQPTVGSTAAIEQIISALTELKRQSQQLSAAYGSNCEALHRHCAALCAAKTNSPRNLDLLASAFFAAKYAPLQALVVDYLAKHERAAINPKAHEVLAAALTGEYLLHMLSITQELPAILSAWKKNTIKLARDLISPDAGAGAQAVAALTYYPESAHHPLLKCQKLLEAGLGYLVSAMFQRYLNWRLASAEIIRESINALQRILIEPETQNSSGGVTLRPLKIESVPLVDSKADLCLTPAGVSPWFRAAIAQELSWGYQRLTIYNQVGAEGNYLNGAPISPQHAARLDAADRENGFATYDSARKLYQLFESLDRNAAARLGRELEQRTRRSAYLRKFVLPQYINDILYRGPTKLSLEEFEADHQAARQAFVSARL